MTTTNEKLRSLFLAALMVFSVFGGTVAFSGGVAATANSSITATPSAANAAATHVVTGEVESDDDSSSLSNIEVDYSVGSNPTDVSDVGQADIKRVGIDSDNDGTIETSVKDDLSSVSASNNGETLEVGFGGSYSLSQGEDVILSYDDVTNPAQGSYSVDVAINTGSTDSPTTSTLTIDSSNNFNPRDVDTSDADFPGVVNPFEAPLPRGSTDNTVDNNFTADSRVGVVNFTFTTAGNVSDLKVNLTGGDNGDVSTSTVDSVNVTLLDGSDSELAAQTVDYDNHNVTANFSTSSSGNVTNVATVIVDANIASSPPADQTIDAEFTAISGNSVGIYDTLGNQTSATQTGFISGNVKDQSGARVANANVTITNGSYQKVVQSDTASEGVVGDYTAEVPPGNYTIQANKPRFIGSPALTRQVEANRTTANLVIRRNLIPDDITVTPEEDSAFVGENNAFTVTVFDQDGNVLSGAEVDASSPNADIEFVSDTTLTTDENGEAEFVVTSDTVVQGAQIEFQAQGGTNPRVNATKNFIQNGEGSIQGTVINDASTNPVEDASVWAVLNDQFRQNTEETVVNLTASSSANITSNQVIIPVEAETGGSGSLTGVSIDYTPSNADVSNVGQGDIIRIGIDTNDDGEIDTDSSSDVSGVSASNNGQTLDITLGGSTSSSAGDDIIVEYTDVQNSDGVSTVNTTLNGAQNNEVSLGTGQTADVFLNTSTDTIFFRLVDNETGQILDSSSDYRVQTPNGSATTVRALTALNTSNASVGTGFVVVDSDGDGEVRFGHTRLAPEDYYAQVSTTAPQNSDNDEFGDASNPSETFANVSAGGSAIVFEPSTDLRLNATEQRARSTGANLVDSPGFVNTEGFDTGGTAASGDFKLTKLFSDFQAGQNYTVIATKTGFNTEFQEVTVTEDGLKYTDGNNIGLNLEPQEVDPDAVNITQIGTRENASATATDEFSNKSDAFAQPVPRDGRTVDEFLVETSAEGTPVNATVEVSIDDVSVDGQYVGVEGGDNVSVNQSQNNITINTGPDGAATVLYQTDSSGDTVETNKTVVLSNDRSATDNSSVEFIGQLTVREAEVSGIVTNENNDPVPANVYLNEIELEGTTFVLSPVAYGTGPDGEDVIRTFRIDRLNASGTGVVASDTFNASYTGSGGDYDFSGFTGVSLGANVQSLTLATLSSDAASGAGQQSSYTLPRVPSIDQNSMDSRVVVRGSSDTSIADNAGPTNDFSDLRNGTSVSTLTEPNRTSTANVEITGAVGGPFQVTNGVVTPNVTTAGTTVDVTADVTNVGGVTDQTDVTVTVEDSAGNVVSSTTTSQVIAAGQTEPVDFTVDTSGLSDGNYTVFVDTPTSSAPATANLEIQSAANPPNYQVDSVSTTPTTINQSDNLTVEADVTNVGGPGSGSVTVEINGTNVSTGTGQLDIIFLLDDSQSMDPFIQDLTDATQDFAATVDQTADAQYAVVTYGTGSVEIDQTLSSNVTQTQESLANVCPGGFCSGGTEVNYDAINESLTGGQLGLRPNARPVIIDLTDEGNNNQTGTPTQGEISQLMEDENAKYIAVSPPDASSEIPSYPAADDKRHLANRTTDGVWYDINSQNLSDQFANEVAGEVANASGGQTVTLNSNESDTVTFNFDSTTTGALAPGDYTVTASTANSSASTNLTVQSSGQQSIVDQYDDNGDGDIDQNEVLDAIVDFNSGTIDQNEVLDVIVAFNS
jgi:surface glycoprotein (TIGR04207 family)